MHPELCAGGIVEAKCKVRCNRCSGVDQRVVRNVGQEGKLGHGLTLTSRAARDAAMILTQSAHIDRVLQRENQVQRITGLNYSCLRRCCRYAPPY